MELLVVMAIISLLSAAAIPTMNALVGAGGLTQAASDLSGTLEQARSYAMSHNTYVYVGLKEVNAADSHTAGTGKIAVATIASRDGTRPYSTLPGTLQANVIPISKLMIVDKVQMGGAANLGSQGGMSEMAKDNALLDVATTSGNLRFQWPLSGTAGYTFDKVIEFDPQGSARMQNNASFDSSIPSYIEILLISARSSSGANNQAALQINGMTGAVRIYRP